MTFGVSVSTAMRMPNLQIRAASLLAIASNAAAQAPATLFGRAVAVVPDRDGDGLADLAVGAPRAPDGALDVGAVVFVSSADGSVLEVLRGDAPQEFFGWYLTSVGTPGAERLVVGTWSGACVRVVDLATCSASFTVRGYSRCMGEIGDLDGDGARELVLCGPGGCAVVSGVSGACVREVTKRRTPTRLREDVGVWIGADFDRDGERDLVVAQLDNGGVELAAVSSRTLEALWKANGPPIQDSITPVAEVSAGALDVDGDGCPEILLALPNHGVQGSVIVIDSTNGRVREQRYVAAGPYGDRGVLNDHAAALRVVPDLDGDGIDEYAVGSPGPAFADRDGDGMYDYEKGNAFGASVVLCSGASGAELRRLAGETFSEIGLDLAWTPVGADGALAIVGVDDGMSHGTNYDNGSLRLWSPRERTARWIVTEPTIAGRLVGRQASRSIGFEPFWPCALDLDPRRIHTSSPNRKQRSSSMMWRSTNGRSVSPPFIRVSQTSTVAAANPQVTSSQSWRDDVWVARRRSARWSKPPRSSSTARSRTSSSGTNSGSRFDVLTTGVRGAPCGRGAYRSASGERVNARAQHVASTRATTRTCR